MYLLTATERLSMRHGLVEYQGHGSELVDLSIHAGVNMHVNANFAMGWPFLAPTMSLRLVPDTRAPANILLLLQIHNI